MHLSSPGERRTRNDPTAVRSKADAMPVIKTPQRHSRRPARNRVVSNLLIALTVLLFLLKMASLLPWELLLPTAQDYLNGSHRTEMRKTTPVTPPDLPDNLMKAQEQIEKEFDLLFLELSQSEPCQELARKLRLTRPIFGDRETLEQMRSSPNLATMDKMSHKRLLDRVNRIEKLLDLEGTLLRSNP